MDITEIHETIFQYLIQKNTEDANLKFTLRVTNANARLEKGYWFSGNDYSVYFSFWSGSDTINRTPNIYFTIDADGKTHLNFSAKDSERKSRFFKALARKLGLYQSKNKGVTVNHWRKYYTVSDNFFDSVASLNSIPYVNGLDRFLSEDKQEIDSAIDFANTFANSGEEIIMKITDNDFHRNLKNILSYRDKLTNRNYQRDLPPIEIVDEYIKLQSLHLANIGHFDTLDIDLDKSVTIIIGENGIGKTTILRAIALSLIGVDESKWVDKEQQTLQDMLKINGENEGSKIYASVGQITLKYELNTVLSDQTHKIQDCDNIINFSDKGDISADIKSIPKQIISISDFEESDFLAHDGEYFKNLVIGFPQVQSKSNKDVINDTEKKPHIRDLIPLLYNISDYRLENFKKWLQYLRNPEGKSLEELENNEKIIQEVLDIVSEVTGNLLKLTPRSDKNEIFIITNDAPNGIPLELISQGFQNVLGWVGYFIKRLIETGSNDDFKQSHAIILIDEIDTYLHPKWQAKILKFLVKKLPNIQFIVTTHSPYVISGLDNLNLNIYSVEKEGNMIKCKLFTDFKTYGADLNRLSRGLMKKAERDDDIIPKLKTYFDLIDDNKLPEAKAYFKSNLKNEIDATDEEIIRAEMLINTKEILGI